MQKSKWFTIRCNITKLYVQFEHNCHSTVYWTQAARTFRKNTNLFFVWISRCKGDFSDHVWRMAI
nr:gustatory receptor [Semanotus bifasciatus]